MLDDCVCEIDQIKLITSDSKKIIFQVNAVLLDFLFIK